MMNSRGQVSLECRVVEGEGLERVQVHRIGRVRLELEEYARQAHVRTYDKSQTARSGGGGRGRALPLVLHFVAAPVTT